jgi:preflagellin peptidase FlaK
VFAVQMMLDLARTATGLAFFLYASWSDHKTREVSNAVWVLFAPIAFVLTFAELYAYEFSQLPYYGMSFGLTAAFAILLFYSGGFGGADAKALMCLALALPFYPSSLPKLLPLDTSPISQVFFPFTVFSNAVLLAAFMAVIMLLYNMFWHRKTGNKLFEGDHRNESIGKKILVLITGYKAPLDTVKEKWHVYPLEDVEESDGKGFKRKLIVLPKDQDRNGIIERLEKAVKNGTIQDRVWATPGLPMLIFITAGLIIALFLGDVVWILIRFLLQ